MQSSREADIDQNVVKDLVVFKVIKHVVDDFRKAPLKHCCCSSSCLLLFCCCWWWWYFCLFVCLYRKDSSPVVQYLSSLLFTVLKQCRSRCLREEIVCSATCFQYQLSPLEYLHLLCHRFGLMLDRDQVTVLEAVHCCDLQKTSLTLSKSLGTHQWMVHGHSPAEERSVCRSSRHGDRTG